MTLPEHSPLARLVLFMICRSLFGAFAARGIVVYDWPSAPGYPAPAQQRSRLRVFIVHE
ncbi:MAG: hypothetical protein M0R30_12970 [Methanoregula sp.]|uniref:hypothetical protein n=1 Tax=Methanoregula sp. TaxID=2052170 RepID=UPI0025EE996C|nr:hypothetical protein [Methanoregula sp.]MCK9632536.1 hypothetical protein [Methanoregula sp.]